MNYFPKKSESAPMIYAYEDKYDPQLKGLLKVGYTYAAISTICTRNLRSSPSRWDWDWEPMNYRSLTQI